MPNASASRHGSPCRVIGGGSAETQAAERGGEHEELRREAQLAASGGPERSSRQHRRCEQNDRREAVCRAVRPRRASPVPAVVAAAVAFAHLGDRLRACARLGTHESRAIWIPRPLRKRIAGRAVPGLRVRLRRLSPPPCGGSGRLGTHGSAAPFGSRDHSSSVSAVAPKPGLRVTVCAACRSYPQPVAGRSITTDSVPSDGRAHEGLIRHILLVAYLYPPCNAASAHRPHGLQRAFESSGIRTTVLTSKISGSYADDGTLRIVRAGDLAYPLPDAIPDARRLPGRPAQGSRQAALVD